MSGKTFGLRGLGVSSIVAAAGLIAAAPAGASTTFGSTAGTLGTCNLGVMAQETSGASPGYSPGAGQGGVIVGWSQRTGLDQPQARLLVWQKTATNSYRLQARSSLKPAPAANSIVSYVESPGIPINTGEKLGVYYSSNPHACLSGGPAGDSFQATSSGVGNDTSDPTVGAIRTMSYNSGAGGHIPITATVEPDADHDLYGDETQDGCPSDPAVHIGGCPPAGDADGDGIPNVSDNCPNNANPSQLDTDGDHQGDACDADDDNDGVLDGADNCPLTNSSNQTDTDGDGQGNPCDADDDNDGVLDTADNCPTTNDPNQLDSDSDGQGNACDADDDNDGVADSTDNCPTTANADQANTDGANDGGDACDADDDNDGLPDAQDPFPLDPLNGGLHGLPTAGADILKGTLNADTICGLGGGDQIDGLAGNDTIFGDQCGNARPLHRAADDGDDVIDGSEGDDTLHGSGGNDTLNGDDGNDKLFGDDGNDKLDGGAGKNTYSGGNGDDRISAANKVKKEKVNCGGGKKDKATIDKGDKPKGCEKVKVKK
jgi:Ca2+-binding RTX toxin-like protein